jgi:hypothetical protein
MATIAKRAVYRELTNATVDDRPLIAGILANGCITLRPKGRRKEFEIPAAWIYAWWKQQERREARAMRRRARKEARIRLQTAMAMRALEDSRAAEESAK